MYSELLGQYRESDFDWPRQYRLEDHVAVIVTGQRYINITRNAIGPKSGQKDCRKF